MATTTTSTLNLKLSYDDYTTRTYKTDWQGNADVAARVKAFNLAAADPSSSIKQTFVSENGAHITAITSATGTTRTTEDIYHA